MEHKYGGTKTQLPRNVGAAQSSIDKKNIYHQKKLGI
jgi:hypothetical protein